MELAESGSEDELLAREIADSVAWVAAVDCPDKGRKLEHQNSEKACQAIALLCRGVPMRTINKECGVGLRVLRRLKVEHSEVIESTKQNRAIQATRLQLKAADALEKKLEDVLRDDEVRGKTSVKDLAMGFGICTDKSRLLHGENTVVTHEHKVTLEDARAAIEEAKKEVSKEVIDV